MAKQFRISVGCDPELFLRDKSGNFVSAHDKLQGTKDKPFPVTQGAVQVDGVAAEFNIDPSFDSNQFTYNIQQVTNQLSSIVGKDFSLIARPAVFFKEDYFKSLPEEVKELGCNADYNAWTGQPNPKPNGSATTMRTGAGHVHLGFLQKNCDPGDPTHFDDCAIIARQMDYYLGLYSLMWDDDTDRRKLYGCAGAFRPKPYGLEYRPLSNRWLCSPKLQTWVWNASYKAVKDLLDHKYRAEDDFADRARDVINNSVKWWDKETKDKDLLKLQSLLKKSGLELPPELPKEVDTLGYTPPKQYTMAYWDGRRYIGLNQNGSYADREADTMTKEQVEKLGLAVVRDSGEILKKLKEIREAENKKVKMN